MATNTANLPPNLVMAAGPQGAEITVTYSIPSGASAGTVIQGNVVAFGPLVPQQNVVVIPITEVWHIVDIYVQGAPAVVDATLITTVNGYVQNINPKLSSLNLNLLTRFRLQQSIPLAPSASFSSSISLLSTTSTSGTQVLTYKVIKSPFTG
jgi:hypothetical protein